MQNWSDSPPERRGDHLVPDKSGGLGDDLERCVDLSRGIWWILHISSCCAELVTFSAREERSDLLPVWCRGLGDDLDEDVDLSRGRDWTTGPAPATSSDRLARVTSPPDHLTTWPPDHLTSLAPYWPNTWAACYLSGKGSGASQSGSIWSTERSRLVLKEVWLLQHLDLNLRLETWTLFKANPSLAK